MRFLRVTRVVHRLKRHAGADGAITDHRNRVTKTTGRFAAQITRNGKAKGGRDGGRGMRRTEGIIHALRAFGEPAEAIFHPQGADAIATLREDLMGVALMTLRPK